MPHSIKNEFLREMVQELHELCQPVTAVRCRLQMGDLMGDPYSLKEAVSGSLEDTRKICESIARLRERLLQEDQRQRTATGAGAT